MALDLILFVVGFVALLKGADFLVEGASSLAKRFGVSTLFIGLTVVAFGTSMPELVVNIFASANGQSDIAIGNILGSNIANILLILGVAATISGLTLSRGTVWREIPFALWAVLAGAILANDALIDGFDFSLLTRSDGLILLGFFTIFIYYAISVSKDNGIEKIKVEKLPIPRSVIMIALGIVGLIIGGKWIVDGAVTIARAFAVSESLIALTIIAIGTSLPELATSAVAAYKKKSNIAVGNIVGSNIFNIFFVLGISAVIRPIPFSQNLISDVVVALGATVILFFAAFVGNKNAMDRWQGVLFLTLYAIYIVYLVIRG
ncbi:MAG: sodium:proton exchanger [Candidatus Harrisonbacteria bacterium CG10_big_fil_rev_8_21_14_0_10_40_38]|uniref:Sodium:proton exchanger n=1 Tax=Candidatus Harrisonbacteria bacterium CG10_big_fil_rev_8_21_14_0_10_40_38 TaxID=1974583 RepID=A0A2H0UTA1_9BACT|nr:MAG: sodium:proton exchanger [Candidatus Harrisonbacteria bacterium CG10_big_fil_rev_8_21_14_0_10_40_38]